MTDLDLRPPGPPDEPVRRDDDSPTYRPRNRTTPRPRRSRRRVMPLALAVACIVGALVVGIVIGFATRGQAPPAGLVTEERAVPVVTVTVTSPAEGTVTIPAETTVTLPEEPVTAP